MSNALLGSPKSDIEAQPHSLRLANDVKRGYSTTPTAHVRDLISDGIKPHGVAIYFAIADRMMTAKGEFFRSNKGLSDDTGISVSCVKKWLRVLRQKGYLTVWYNNGNRRMRVSTGVRVGTPRNTEGYPQVATDKENNIKKTTQQKFVCVFSDSHKELLGGQLDRLVSKYGEIQVRDGLRAWDATDQSRVDNPVGWITDAIKHHYPTRPAKPAKFPESLIEQEKIIAEYVALSVENAHRVSDLYAEYETKNGYKGGTAGIAHKIYRGKI